jgi:hypothetical protein
MGNKFPVLMSAFQAVKVFTHFRYSVWVTYGNNSPCKLFRPYIEVVNGTPAIQYQF